MSNQYNTAKLYCMEFLLQLQDNNVLLNTMSYAKTDDLLQTSGGIKPGQDVSYSLAGDFEVKDFSPGGTVVDQDTRQAEKTLTLDKYWDVSGATGSREKILDENHFNENVTDPVAKRFAEKMDIHLASKVNGAANMYTSAAPFADFADLAAIDKEADAKRIIGARSCLVGATAKEIILANANFNQMQTMGTPGVSSAVTGTLPRLEGVDYFSSINFDETAWIAGTFTGATANTGGKNLIGASTLTVAVAGTVKDNDRLQVAGCHTHLVVDGDQTTVTAIALKNPITEIVTDGAAITTVGSGKTITPYGVLYDKKLIAYLNPMLPDAEGALSSSISAEGLAVRFVSQYSRETKVHGWSFDSLFGADVYDHRHGMLICKEA